MRKNTKQGLSTQFLLAILLMLLFMAGCSLKQRIDYISEQRGFPVLTKASLKGGENKDYVVTENDLQNFVKFRVLEGLSKGRNVVLSEIIPLYWEDEPCLYVLQYEDGFEVLSADKRSPIPIASNAHGRFEESNDPEGFGGHLDLMAEEIWFLKNGYLTNPLPESEEYIQSSLDFWNLVNADSSFINSHRIKIKGHPPINPDLPRGHWELTGVYTEEVVYDSIPHLTTTNWYQRGIYNFFCPEDIDTNYIINKCPAGCVAIAGAQMLYFLHQKDGLPTTSPSKGICTGEVYNNNVYQCFWDYSSSTWSSMQPRAIYADTCAALLIGDLGKRLEMEYGWNGSFASTEDLKDDVFSPYGWNCTYLNGYEATHITSSLYSGYPVVCGGLRQNRGVGMVGHSFLIDRYKLCQTKTTAIYEWIPDNPDPAGSTFLFEPIDSVSYSSPHISYYGMNWGQYYLSPNSTWCSLDGIWWYHHGNVSYFYVYNQEMIYGFTKKN